MHGIIFVELKKYVTANMGANAWQILTTESGMGSKIYMPIIEYADEEALKLVETTPVCFENRYRQFGKILANLLSRT